MGWPPGTDTADGKGVLLEKYEKEQKYQAGKQQDKDELDTMLIQYLSDR
jgi:hypothetical protein